MITTTDEGPLRVVTFDRPDTRNALTPAGLHALETAVADADAPVVYLHGAGDAFCAGADLDVVSALDGEEAAEFAERGQTVARTIAETDSVVVAGIDGPARGGGVELALACDLRIATPAATFAETGVTLGLFGAWGGTVRLPRIVGEGDAMDIALSGRVIDAETALRMGLVSRVVQDPHSVARKLTENDHGALALLKERLRDRADDSTQQQRETDAFVRCIERASFDRS